MRRHSPTILTLIVFSLLASALLTVSGCHSDPHDTHIQSNVSAAR